MTVRVRVDYHHLFLTFLEFPEVMFFVGSRTMKAISCKSFQNVFEKALHPASSCCATKRLLNGGLAQLLLPPRLWQHR